MNNNPDLHKSFFKSISLLVLASFTLIIISGLVGYFLAKKTNVELINRLDTSQNTSPTPSVFPTPTQTLTIDGTKNWKNYEAPDKLKKLNINFSVKYPSNWFSSENNPNNTSYVPNVVFSSNNIPDVYTRNFPCFSIKGGIWDITTNVQGIIKEEDSTEIITTSGKKISIAPKVESQEDIIVNGMTGIHRKIIKYEENQVSDEIVLKDGLNTIYGSTGENFYIIESCPGTDSEIFNKILSTFNVIQ